MRDKLIYLFLLLFFLRRNFVESHLTVTSRGNSPLHSSIRRDAIEFLSSGHSPIYVLEIRERLFRTWLGFMRLPSRRWTVAKRYVREIAKVGQAREDAVLEEIFRFAERARSFRETEETRQRIGVMHHSDVGYILFSSTWLWSPIVISTVNISVRCFSENSFSWGNNFFPFLLFMLLLMGTICNARDYK